MILARYPKESHIHTTRDPLLGLLILLEFFSSQEYVVDVLVKRHAVTLTEARKRARRIVPHVKTGLLYLEQAFSGPPDVAFLPIYYALLNFVKVYILTSSKHSLLNANRRHGASYDVYAKASQNLRTEEITIYPKGAIALFYEVVSGSTIGRKTSMRLSDIYPFIFDVSAEWGVTVGETPRLISATFNVNIDPQTRKKQAHVLLGSQPFKTPLTLAQLPILVDFDPSPTNPQQWLGKRKYDAATDDQTVLREHVRPFLLYYSERGMNILPICQKKLLMFEELPIVLSFFHLSSVARYNPEFLARIRDSRFWPVVSSLRFNGLMKFLLLFWSFMQQEILIFHR